MKYECIETTIDFDHKGWDVRLWIGETGVYWNREVVDIIEQVKSIMDSYSDKGHFEDMIKLIAESTPNLNAIQMRTKQSGYKQGMMVYCVPF